MEKITSFPKEIHNQLGYYVYRLIDPRNGQTFYVGKGKNNRVFDHTNGTIEISKNTESDEDDLSLKIKLIQEIKNAGLEIIHIIHRHGIEDEKTALEVEAGIIDAYQALTNIKLGNGSSAFGSMHVLEVINKYRLEVADFEEYNIMMINVNKSSVEFGFYMATRYCWKINLERAKKADYIFSIVRGVIKEVFIVDEWEPATNGNFPEFEDAFPNRFGFTGRLAPEKIRKNFINKLVPSEYTKRGAAYPIKYNYSI